MIENIKKAHYGWVILAGCMMMIFCSVGLAINVFSIFLTPLTQEFGFTKTQASTIMSMISIGSILILLVSGKIYQRFKTRIIMFLFGMLIAIGFTLFASSRTLFGCYAAAFLVGIGSGGGGMVPTSILITRWFATKRGIAISLSAMGSGLGSMIFSPLTAFWIERFGLQMAFILYGSSIAVLVLVAFLLIRNDPVEKGLQPYGHYSHVDNSLDMINEGISFPEAVRSKRYRGLVITVFLIGLMISPINNHLPSFLISIGYEPMFAAKVFSLFGGTLIVGKLLAGVIIDRFGITSANLYLFFVWGLAMLSAFFIDGSPAKAYVLTVLIGLGNPILTVPIPIWVAHFFGLRDFAKIYSSFSLIMSFGVAIGFSLIGVLVDLTGNYLTIYGAFLGIDILVLIFLHLIFRGKQISTR